MFDLNLVENDFVTEGVRVFCCFHRFPCLSLVVRYIVLRYHGIIARYT